jgi:hypothetical protein
VDLVLPYYYEGGLFNHFLFLSRARRSLSGVPRQATKDTIVSAANEAFKAIHISKVLHCDPALRNVLYDTHTGRGIVVDLKELSLLIETPLD